MGLPALSTTHRTFHPEVAGVALGIGKEVSKMREITLEDYKQADRQLEREEARRGFTIHAIVYALVMAGLIILNLTVATEFPWAVFPLVCWGFGLTMHYLFGVRWVGKVITDRQAKVEQRAAAGKRAA
jgi:2TM domain